MSRSENAVAIVEKLLESDPDDIDVRHYLAGIEADKALGKVTYQAALTCNRFYHRTKRYRSRPNAPLEARRNGATKTWKTRPGQFRIPVKYGMREYFYIDNNNADDWATIPDFKSQADYDDEQRQSKQSQEMRRLLQMPVKPHAETDEPATPTVTDPRQQDLFQ